MKCMATKKTKKEKPETTGIIRTKEGRFVKGVSGNPKGRPEGSLSLVSILKKKLNEIAPNSRKTWAELFVDKMFFAAISDKGDAQLMKDIVNRIDGMPKQNIGIGVDDTIEKIEVEIVKFNDTKTKNNSRMGKELPSVSEPQSEGDTKSGGDGVEQIV